MPAPRLVVSADLVARWDELREDAAEQFSELEGRRLGGSVLERVAWLGGLPEGRPFSEALRVAINEARLARCTWREVALALGLGEGDGVEKRVAARQAERNAQAASSPL